MDRHTAPGQKNRSGCLKSRKEQMFDMRLL
jgi:hypothetical protein